MKEIIRCGICGLGRIGWGFHLPAIRATAGLELTAVADPLPERLLEAENTFQAGHCSEDWKALAEPGLLDMVVIASPTRFHKEQCLYFLQHGLDVFCDKPMALTLADAQEMADTAKHCGRKLMVYQPHRLTGLAVKAKEIMESGKLGRIYQLRRNCFSFVRRNDWQAFTALGGGMLNNYGAHFLDQLLYLGGDHKAEHFRCETMRVLSGGDAEDVVHISMRGKSGVLYLLEINMAMPVSCHEFEICGDKGCAVFDGKVWHLKYKKEFAELKTDENMAAPGRSYPPREKDFIEEEAVNPEMSPYCWYEHVRSYFCGSAAPFVPVEDTLEIMRLLEAGRVSSSEFWR